MIGDASMVSPIAEGMVSKKASRIPRARIARNSSIFPIAALFATSGSVTVPIATPKIPSGNCISRKAILSQLTGPPAMASSYFNLGSIIGGVAIGSWLDPHFGARSLTGLAIGTLIGGTWQLIAQFPSLHRVGYMYRTDFRWR